MTDLNYCLKLLRGAKIPIYRINTISSLNKETIDRLAEEGRDRRTINPLLDWADKMNGGITDDNVNELLDDDYFTSKLIEWYCK